ncbi:MAG: polyribonucleotide nucleotidyltransferase [Candidatus Omnitrophica bacterium]|nr:polyribonucleotide nucleotidyltransferase [Candidatus Omnitrophota bacterium]
MIERVEFLLGGKNIIIETGKFANQANAAVTVTCGGTVVLAAVCMAKAPKPDAEFFPLMVDYQEKTYSAGRIPGGFFKREGRPTQKEILTARLIDRPIRPLFPEGFYNDVIITATVLSSDGENDPDVLAIIAASTALTISDVPFEGPVGAVRVGLLDDEFVVNPTYAERQACAMEMVVVGLADKIVMIETEGNQIPELRIAEAYRFALEELQASRLPQLDLRKKMGKSKAKVDLFQPPAELKDKVLELAVDRLHSVYTIADKQERENARQAVLDDILADLTVFAAYKAGDRAVAAGEVKMLFDVAEYQVVRAKIFKEQKRADGRGLKEIRPISCEVNLLPRTHGSSLFSRGQTQSLSVVTLGTRRDEQMIESLEGVSYENFMLHYNFPPYSVGEAKGSRAPGRREIGHGALAVKALKIVLPKKEDFPYTIRVVSEIMESNGSSSMASVCAGCLSLMAAGVPITDPVAGISIGLISGDGKQDSVLLTDIMGSEDHFGDMDYKIAGTKNGVTAVQLDIKVKGIALEDLIKGLAQAREARMQILDKMAAVISMPAPDLSEYAPRILITSVPPDKIGEVIGPGGKMIKKIIEETGAESIDIDDDGKVTIAALGKEKAQKALQYVQGFAIAPEIGKVYEATVMKVMNFGAFCEILPGKQGLVHVSEFAKDYVKDMTQVAKVGDKFKVVLFEIDKMNRLNLSRKRVEETTAQ